MSKTKKQLSDLTPEQFPVIRSGRCKAANVEDIRKRMAEATKVARRAGKHVYHGASGFIEVSIQDLLAKGGLQFGRNFVLPPCGTGVHDVAEPKFASKDGVFFTHEEREANKKRAWRLIGANANSSMTAKAMMAVACMKAGVRCILYSDGRIRIVDTWPDYLESRKALADNDCFYSLS